MKQTWESVYLIHLTFSLKSAENLLEQTAKRFFKLAYDVISSLPHQIQIKSGIVVDKKKKNI